MKFLFSGIICLFALSLSAQQPTYSRVKIFTDDAGLNQLSFAGIPVDHGEYRHGCCFTTDLSEDEIQRVRNLGFNYTIEIPDVQSYYAEQNNNPQRNSTPEVTAIGCTPAALPVSPANWTLGSMGGFYTLTEIYWHLDNMATLYPSLVKPRVAIDSANLTFEGRMIYWMKISDNPLVDENEPEGLYTAAHHAREPAGVSQLIMYMYYLLENYATNPEIQYIVNNTELYFIPLVNPDGYFYNETIAPGGGGMWRKNRLDHQNGEFGVDLNRNYSYNWGFDNTGSSPNDMDNTYRGASPASEPEVQCVQALCNAHNFRIAINYHTYGNLLICPWGYQPSFFTPDAPVFNAWGTVLTSENSYRFGTPDQTVGYVVNGSSDDWMYGEQTSKPKIMAMTPEAGDPNDGFWPASNLIEDICRENIAMDLNAARLLLAYATVENADGKYMSGPNSYFHFDVERMGLDSSAVYTVSIQPISAQITSVGAPRTYSTLSIATPVADSISYSVNPSTAAGTPLTYVVELSNGVFTWRDTLTRIYGNPIIVYSTNATAATGWNTANGWDVTTEDFVSSPTSFTDSPFSYYNPNAYSSMPMTQNVSLAGAISAQLRFKTRFELEANYDFVQVQVSTDGGNNWTSLCGKYTTSDPNLNGGEPLYTGFQSAWVNEAIDLDNYVGSNIMIQFQLVSDFWTEYDGIYIDDLVIEVLDSTSSIHEYQSSIVLGQNIPNPAGEFTFIPVDAKSGGVIEIYSQLGELVMAENVPANSGGVQLSVATLAEGVYFYRFHDGINTSESRKLVVTHQK